MKKTHVIILIAIAVTAGVIIARTGDYTTYANFIQAKEKGSSVNVVGYLVKDKPMNYDPQKDPNFFSFINYFTFIAFLICHYKRKKVWIFLRVIVHWFILY